MKNKLKISISQSTSKGIKDVNQDFHDIKIPTGHQLINKGIAVAIADGISSSDVSQEASKSSVNLFIEDYYSTPESWSVQKSAKGSISTINSQLYLKSRQGEHRYDRDRGYVCTFTGMILKSNTAHIFHIGDVRIYQLRDNELRQVTTDHRLWISQDKSYLSRALGMDSEVLIDYEKLKLLENDIYLLMSDGVYEYLEQQTIIDIVSENHEFEHSANKLIELALGNSSDDNLTAQVIRIDSIPDKDVSELYQELDDKKPAPILQPKETLDNYLIIRNLSANHRSHVYLAVDNYTGKNVVIKVPSVDLRDDKVYLERFMTEEWIARRINNVHVLKSYQQSHPRNYLYTVFEYIEGQTLAQWLIDNPKPTLEEVRVIIEQIAKGLQAFHRHEMIHQDIRPENILIDKSGTVKIIDFGSTRVEAIEEMNSLIKQDHILGTLQYSAPEYFLQDTGTTASDIYSLAVIAYYMLSKKFPYGTNVAKATTKLAQKKLKYNSLYTDEFEIPYWIDQTLKKALIPNPFYRYSLLSEFTYDMRHPNQKFISNSQPAIYIRHPIAFWKSISFILFSVILYLLYLL
ncbi:bifunctional protein-serine/threonine kinase/phosphatase [Sulfurimonas sp.]|nr:bifunctional protein-serine/threonine kinase/phosphatase [Sulfurimonas sp.]